MCFIVADLKFSQMVSKQFRFPSFLFAILDFRFYIPVFDFKQLFSNQIIQLPASWSSGHAFGSGTVGLRFKSQAVQIRHSAANGSTLQRNFSERSCVARAR